MDIYHWGQKEKTDKELLFWSIGELAKMNEHPLNIGNETDDALQIIWHCSMTINILSSPWGDEEVECNTDFITEVDANEYAEEASSAVCPNCHNTLWQSEDYHEVIK